jgi:hypothetical protein
LSDEYRRARWSTIRKKPALGFDPRVDADFPKRSSSNETLEHDLEKWKPAFGQDYAQTKNPF